MDSKTVKSFPSPLVAQAYQYYLKGLNAKETGKLLDISPRTVQRYAKAHGFKKRASPGTLQQRASQLQALGYSYNAIAGILCRSRTTIYNYLKRAQTKKVG